MCQLFNELQLTTFTIGLTGNYICNSARISIGKWLWMDKFAEHIMMDEDQHHEDEHSILIMWNPS